MLTASYINLLMHNIKQYFSTRCWRCWLRRCCSFASRSWLPSRSIIVRWFAVNNRKRMEETLTAGHCFPPWKLIVAWILLTRSTLPFPRQSLWCHRMRASLSQTLPPWTTLMCLGQRSFNGDDERAEIEHLETVLRVGWRCRSSSGDYFLFSES